MSDNGAEGLPQQPSGAPEGKAGSFGMPPRGPDRGGLPSSGTQSPRGPGGPKSSDAQRVEGGQDTADTPSTPGVEGKTSGPTLERQAILSGVTEPITGETAGEDLAEMAGSVPQTSEIPSSGEAPGDQALRPAEPLADPNSMSQPPLPQTPGPSTEGSNMGVPPASGAVNQGPSSEGMGLPPAASATGASTENEPAAANPTATPGSAEQPGGSVSANQAGSAEQGTEARSGAQAGTGPTPREGAGGAPGAGTPQGAAAQAAERSGAPTAGPGTREPASQGQAQGAGEARPGAQPATPSATEETPQTPPAAQPPSREQPPSRPTEQTSANGQNGQESSQPAGAEAAGSQPPNGPKKPDNQENAPEGRSPTTPPPAEGQGGSGEGTQDHKSIDEMKRDYFDDNLKKDPKNKKKYDKLRENAFRANSDDQGDRKLDTAFQDYKEKRAKGYAESNIEDTATEDEKLLDFLRRRANAAKNHEDRVKRSNAEVLLHNFMEQKDNKARLDTYFDESLTSDEKAQALKEVEDNFKPGMNRLKELWHNVNRGLDEMKPSVVKEHFGLVRKHLTLWSVTKEPEHLKLAWEHARKGGLRMIGTVGIGLFLLSLACWVATPLLVAQTPRFLGKGGS